MTRLIKKTYAQLTPAQQATFDEIVANRPFKPADGHIGGPFDIWLRSPEMGTRLLGLGSFFRFRSSVGRRYIELAILVTGAYWRAQFEWFAHEPMARDAGVPEAVIAAVKAGETPVFEDSGDAAAYNLARQLHENRKLSDEAFAEAVTQFGETGVAELIGLCGFYSLVSMTLNGFDVELPDGETYPFDRD